MSRSEIMTPWESVNLERTTRNNLYELPRPALVNLISSANPKMFPGPELNQLSQHKLIGLAIQNPIIPEYISHRYEQAPGLLGRLHLSLWQDAFPIDDKDYCLKMRFAAAFVNDNYRVVMRSQNRRMITDRLCNGATCVRDQITSRTDAVMGDCGHAYLWGVQQLLKDGWTTGEIKSLTKYEAGFYRQSPTDPDVWYEPWVGKEPAYTCLYCITILRWFLEETEVTVMKSLDGQSPAWTDINLTRAFYDEAVRAAQKQGLSVPCSLDQPRNQKY